MKKEPIPNDAVKVIFESERCYTRRFIESDLTDFISYRNNLEWMKYQYFKGLSREEYEDALLKEPSVESGVQLAIIRKADQKLLGDVYVKKEENLFWIGSTVSPVFKRQGYAYEIVRSLILWIRQQGDYNIMAGAAPENIASIRLLEKLGFSLAEESKVEMIYSLNPATFYE
ncbi:GNAT family N-acetyltransferase [Planococcus sp. CAU13]|uniref:GNAT family N-acetyltransferase n=1 Tax=Planococcus sp. CAU13 TaxID=1541197 RepID=UPI00068DA146|nr:GNAT family N-acetyltransferase [Planococcus sp. CAU13]